MAEISIRNVRKSYGKTEVLHGIDLEVRNGEFLVVLGPSGCGKSTLLRMIAGLEEISSGEIAIGGKVVNRLEPRERGCAMVFQNYALYPHMTVAENIGYALRIQGVRKAERMERVRQIAEVIGLTETLDRKPGQLSGGQRQRVAMGRAIIREPKVFLFDEPLSNLDATLRVQMRLEIRNLHQRLGATSVFVTHDQIEAMTLADRLVVMNAGNIEQVGTPGEVYDTPATRYVGRFIGAPPMNFVAGTVSRDGATFHVDGGQTIPLDPAIGRVAAGQRMDAGVRPEHVRFSVDGPATDLTALYRFSEELGASRLLHVEVAGGDFIIHTSEARQPSSGATLHLSVSPEKVSLFDPATGRRTGPAAQDARLAAE